MRNADEAKPLPVEATVRGRIGGEAHDSYVIYARDGQTMTVNLVVGKGPEVSRAEFTVSRSDNFFGSEPIDFGQRSGCE
jgi:hypothetical protein